MTEVAEITDGMVMLTINQLANVTAVDRRTVEKKLNNAGIQPCSTIGVKRLYMARDCVRIILNADDSGRLDPDKLPPYERQAHYKAELDKLKLDENMRRVIPVFEAEQEQARIIRVIALTLDTLPDKLERDKGVAPDVVAYIESELDEAREQIYKDITQPKEVEEVES